MVTSWRLATAKLGPGVNLSTPRAELKRSSSPFWRRDKLILSKGLNTGVSKVISVKVLIFRHSFWEVVGGGMMCSHPLHELLTDVNEASRSLEPQSPVWTVETDMSANVRQKSVPG